jgi:hypothetical protein
MWMMPLCAFAPRGKLGRLSSGELREVTGDVLGSRADQSDVAVGPDHDAAAFFEPVALGDGPLWIGDDGLVAGS